MEELQTEHGIFANNEETGQTAQEVYEEWLANKDKPLEPTLEERIQMAEDTILYLLIGGM